MVDELKEPLLNLGRGRSVNSYSDLRPNTIKSIKYSERLLSKLTFGIGVQESQEKPVEGIWDGSKTWEVRKKEAIEDLKNQTPLFSAAYRKTYTKFKTRIIESCSFNKNISDQKKLESLEQFNKNFVPKNTESNLEGMNKLRYSRSKSEINKAGTIVFEKDSNFKFDKNNHCLTPLIFAIWGYLDDKTNLDRRNCLDILLKIIASDIEKHIKFLGNELGHLYVHYFTRCENILGPNKVLELIIKNDFTISLVYIIEKKLLMDILKEKILSYNVFILAIINESLESVNVLFSHINSLDSNNFREFVGLIETEFYEIFLTKSSLLKPFLDKLMKYEPTKVNVNKKDLPLIVFIDETNIDQNQVSNRNSLEVKESIASVVVNNGIYQYGILPDKKSKLDTVEVWNSLLKLPSINGSHSSYKFMVNLILKSNTEIYKSDIVKYYILKKWDSLWDIIFLESLLLWGSLLLVILWISDKSLLYVVLLIIINSTLLVFELCQIYSLSLKDYFGGIEMYTFKYIMFWCLSIWNFLVPTYPTITFWVCCAIHFTSQCKNYRNKLDKKFDKISAQVLFFGSLFAFIFIKWMNVGETVFILFIIAQGIIIGGVIAALILYHKSTILYFEVILIHFKVFFLVYTVTSNSKDLVLLSQIVCISFGFFVSMILVALNKKEEKLIIPVIISSITAMFTTLYYFLDYISITITFYSLFSVLLVYEILVVILALRKKIFLLKYGVPHMVLILFALRFYSGEETLYYFIVYLFLEVFSRYLKSNKFFSRLFENLFRFVFNWNTIDMVRLLVFFIWVGFFFISEPSNTLIWALSLMSFIRGLTAFRCFNKTRYYVRLVFKCIADINSFLIIVCYSTLGFGLIREIYKMDIKKQSLPFTDILVISFNQEFGNPDSPGTFNFEYFIYLVACTINIIVMLNLLISILGKSFEDFNKTKDENDYMEMAESIFEIESILIYRRLKLFNFIDSYLYNKIGKFISNKTRQEPDYDKLQYLLVWDHWMDNTQNKETTESAENFQKEFLEDRLRDFDTKIDQVKNKIDLTNKSVAKLDQKIEKVLSYIQNLSSH